MFTLRLHYMFVLLYFYIIYLKASCLSMYYSTGRGWFMIYKVISNALDVIRSNAFNVLERVIGQ